MKLRVLLIVVYIMMQHVFYGILGDMHSTGWTLYYLACPVVLCIGLLLLEIKTCVGKTLKFSCWGLIGVSMLYYLRLVAKYDKDYEKFMASMNEDAVYWTPIIICIIALLLILKTRK